uniref:Protein TIC 214 n=1 Tax=Tanaecium tetragonolobum TaxID=353963 RepID=A0A0M4BZ98_9LAMI|nr:hypothetical chloroplast RF19 [Tanaecium tetragonolobum]ALB78312.1 hypothetical chloroplast RF19 [Tanaecium tetragonolobum]
MIFPSCLLGNRVVSLCMKIINSVVVVGLYYGFLTAFSIGHSYLLLLRVQLIEKGTEKKVSATTGFIMGQLMVFISTYYAPLHLALNRPHTIIVLPVPYILFHFFWYINKDFFDYGSTTRNSMRNFSIQCVFLNNLIFPLFNHLILPSSMLARLVNIYMFRCNNKMLFVTSGFVGWLIGHILFMKWLGLVFVWIRQNRSIIWRWNRYLRSNKDLLYVKNLVLDVSELINSMARIFSLLFLISSIYYLGRMPSPILTKKEPSKVKESEEEGDVEEEERDVEIERASEMKGTKQEQEGFTGEDPSPSLFSEEKADPNKIAETEDEFHFRFTETDYKNRPVSDSSDSEESYLMNMNENHEFDENEDPFFFNKPLVTLLFDLNRWNRPFRYIKNNQIEGGVRKEMSQYFFDICQSDGKERISFTYPPSLSIFLEMIKRRISPHTLEKSSSNELDNPWVYTNKQKVKNFNNEFLNRIEALDKKKKYILLDILETRTRLCNDDSKKEYLSQRYDPFLNGSYRRTIYKSPSILTNFIEELGKNRIHGLLLPDTDYHEFEQKINGFEPLSTEIVTDANEISRKSEEMSKKVPRWSSNLITELEQESDEYPEEAPDDHEIRTRKAKRVVIFTINEEDLDPTIVKPDASDEPEEVALMRYSQKSDFRRSLIKGSMRAQRRKMGIWLFYQPHVHSPLFLDKIRKFPFFYFDDISGMINRIFRIFRNWVRKGEAFKIVEYTEQQPKREEKKETNRKGEEARMEIAEAWDDFPCGQAIRSLLLLSHSFSRKYIRFPSFIIAKNIGRMLLLQRPEWSEDFQELNQEMHVKCTYNGVPLSETEFPKDWLLDGIQIKILFPFRLKPWHKSNLGSSEKNLMQNNKEDFCFLTVWGREAARPFGSPRKQPSFFKPILKELEKQIRQLPEHYIRARIVFKRKTKLFQQVSKETKNWVIKSLIFITRIIKELSKVNPIRLLRLKEVEVYESSEIKEEKDSIISNQIIHESFNQIPSPSWKNSSVTEKKMKDLTDRTSTIRNQIERITKEKKKVTPRINNLSPNKTSYNAKRFEKWQILKRRTAGLIAKLPLFFKSFIQRIYTDIFLSIMNIPRMNTELSLESTKKNFFFFFLFFFFMSDLSEFSSISFCCGRTDSRSPRLVDFFSS